MVKEEESDGISKSLAEKKLARYVVEEVGLPRGPVVRILEEHGVDKAVIDRIATQLVPYGNT
jgi:hypothetical protein